MAGRKKRKDKKAARRSAGRVLAALLLTAAALLLAAMTIWGGFVTLECTDLPLRDLPSAFDGVKIVYISDIHLTTFNSLSKVKSLFRRLEKLKPDLLLLGGDYTGNDLVRMAANIGDDSAYDAAMIDLRDLFFLSLSEFDTSLGKFAVAGDMDNLLERSAGTALEDAAALGGVTLLRDKAARVVKDGQTLTVVGVDELAHGASGRAHARGGIGGGRLCDRAQPHARGAAAAQWPDCAGRRAVDGRGADRPHAGRPDQAGRSRAVQSALERRTLSERLAYGEQHENAHQHRPERRDVHIPAGLHGAGTSDYTQDAIGRRNARADLADGAKRRLNGRFCVQNSPQNAKIDSGPIFAARTTKYSNGDPKID